MNDPQPDLIQPFDSKNFRPLSIALSKSRIIPKSKSVKLIEWEME